LIVVVLLIFFFSSRRRHTRSKRDWSSDVCSSDLLRHGLRGGGEVYDALLSAGGVQEAQVVRAHVVGVLVFFFLSSGEALGQLEHGHAHRLGDEQVAVFSGGNAVYVGVAVLALLRRGGGSVARQLA